MLFLVVFFFVQYSNADSCTSDPIKELIAKAGTSKQYPRADMLVVFDSTRVDMQENGLSRFNEHKLYKVLTSNGAKKHNVFKYDYDPLSAFAQIEKIKIYYKNGTEKVITLDDELDYPAPATVILWGARQKMIELGRLEPGDAFEVFLFKKGFTYALLKDENSDDERFIPPMRGHFYDIVPFWNDYPVLKKVYQVAIPNTKKVQYKVYNGKLDVTKKNKGEKTLYTFVAGKTMSFKREPGMVALSDVAPKVLISTSPDWYAKSKWFYGVNEDYGSFESTPEIDQKVNEILKGAKNELDSVSRLTHWVADEIRYFGLSMGKGEGFTLHKGSMNYLDRCGVCKDKAGMLVTMLRSAGFESYAAMTMAGSRIDYIPADQFNHSVVVVKLSDGKLHPLDPTWVPFIRELWSSAEQQQNYLPGTPEGSDLLETPTSSPENHYIKIKGSSVLDKNGTLTGTINIEAEGQTDAALRRLFTSSRKAQWEQNLKNQLLDVCPQAVITTIDYNADPYDYMAAPINMTIKYSIPGYAVVTGDEIIFTPLAATGIFRRGMRHLRMNVGIEERKHPYREACSRMVEIEEQTTLPYNCEIAWQPVTDDVEGSGASYTGGYTINGKDVKITEKATFNKRIYQPEDWSSYREAVIAQKKFADNPIILKIKK